MTFPTDDIQLGPPAYGARKGHEGICWHTTESGGPSRASAVATASWQAGPGNTSRGSYNFIIYDGGILLTVPYLEAAGGISTNRTNPPWNPQPWLKTLLSPAAFADPNAYLLNVAFSGKAADLAASKYPANMIETAARLVLWFEADFGKDDAVLCAHADWQTDRTDPGKGVVDRILARYLELKAPPADYKALYEAEKAKVAAQAQRIADLMNVVARKDAALDRISGRVGELAESVDFARRIA